MLNKVLFLDIDGPVIPNAVLVVNNHASIARSAVSLVAIGHLKLMCHYGGVKIVTNSSHNDENMVITGRLLRDDLITHGLPEKYFHDNWRTEFGKSIHNRMQAINDWLKRNGDHHWVCFDDIAFTTDPRLIVVSYNDGILYDDVQKAFDCYRDQENAI